MSIKISTEFLTYEEKLHNLSIESVRWINIEDCYCIFLVKHFVNGLNSCFSSVVLPYTKSQLSVVFKTSLLGGFITIFPIIRLSTFPILTPVSLFKDINLHANKMSTFFTILSYLFYLFCLLLMSQKFFETSNRRHPPASNPEGLAELFVFLISSLNQFYHTTGYTSWTFSSNSVSLVTLHAFLKISRRFDLSNIF